MENSRKSRLELGAAIVGTLVRRHSTAVVLFHHAVAERLGLGPTDIQCLNLLRERGAMTGSDLAAITSLTSGAITGVVARLERAGFVSREPDSHDGRKYVLRAAPQRMQDIHAVFDPVRKDAASLLRGLDTAQLNAIAEFLAGCTDLIYRHASLLRAHRHSAPCADLNGVHIKISPVGKAVPPARPAKARRKRN